MRDVDEVAHVEKVFVSWVFGFDSLAMIQTILDSDSLEFNGFRAGFQKSGQRS